MHGCNHASQWEIYETFPKMRGVLGQGSTDRSAEKANKSNLLSLGMLLLLSHKDSFSGMFRSTVPRLVLGFVEDRHWVSVLRGKYFSLLKHFSDFCHPAHTLRPILATELTKLIFLPA